MLMSISGDVGTRSGADFDCQRPRRNCKHFVFFATRTDLSIICAFCCVAAQGGAAGGGGVPSIVQARFRCPHSYARLSRSLLPVYNECVCRFQGFGRIELARALWFNTTSPFKVRI